VPTKCQWSSCTVIIEFPSKVHEETVKEFKNEVLIDCGNSREFAKLDSMTAIRHGNPNKEADATFGLKRTVEYQIHLETI
jgi:hypothetical protein